LQSKISFKQAGNLKRHLNYHTVDGRGQNDKVAQWRGGTLAKWQKENATVAKVKCHSGKSKVAEWHSGNSRLAIKVYTLLLLHCHYAMHHELGISHLSQFSASFLDFSQET
jgi:hypothetical protein